MCELPFEVAQACEVYSPTFVVTLRAPGRAVLPP